MKKRLILLICILALGLSACGKTEDKNEPSPTAGATPTVEVTPTKEAENSQSGGNQNGENGSEEEFETWAPEEAPPVRNQMTDEEKREAELAILEKGTFLFSDETDGGYYPADISWLTSAGKDDAIALIYACDDLSHGGWGVLGFRADTNGGKQYSEDVNAMSDEPAKERLIVYPM